MNFKLRKQVFTSYLVNFSSWACFRRLYKNHW